MKGLLNSEGNQPSHTKSIYGGFEIAIFAISLQVEILNFDLNNNDNNNDKDLIIQDID